MLRVLALSTLFPTAAQPTFGLFVERQLLGLAAHPDVEVEVVAPVGLPPWPLSFHPRYRQRARLPRRETWKGLLVHRPTFPILPRIGERWTARSMAASLLPLLRQIRKRFPFDVIDAEFFWPDGPAAMRLGRVLGVPFSVTARGSDIQYWMHRPAVAPQLIEAARAAGGMLAVSGALREVMAGFGMPRERIRRHYTGVDRDIFRPLNRAAVKAELGIDGPLILTCGALIPGKGQRTAIAALERIPGSTLLLAGDGPDRGALERIVRERRLEDRVRLLGNRPHAEIARLMAAADVMLLPSRSEGLANVWVEALSSGTPVVTCDVGGAREVIDRPEAGALVPPDPAAMAEAVSRILADPPDPERVRAASERFRWEENSAALRDHLMRVAAGEKVS
jgi:glycosyltransferase involved in cell wall biosynthesis